MEQEFWRTPYEPPSMSAQVVRFLVVVFAFFTLIRGIGYATLSGTEGAESLLVLKALASIQIWGLLLASGSIYLLLAVLWIRLQMAVWIGHVFLCALHFCVSITVMQSVWQFHGSGPQAVTVPLSTFVWHAVFVWLLRPQARGSGSER